MREIKFRAWSKELKLMAYDIQNEYDTIGGVRFYKDGIELDEEPGETSFHSYLNNEKYIVMQFTGIKDKNGKEIYEGDIVYDKMNDKFAEVKMNSFGRWSLYWINWERMNEYHGECFFDWISPDIQLEIKGNIYENHNLLI